MKIFRRTALSLGLVISVILFNLPFFTGTWSNIPSMITKVEAVGSNSVITTQLSTNSITVGQTVTDTATVSGNDTAPTGSVQFQVSPDGSNFTGFGNSVPLTVSGNNTSTAISTSWIATGPGTYYFRVIYSGDANYCGSTSGNTAEPLIVTYALTLNVCPPGSGSVSADPSGPFQPGDRVRILACPSCGYEFEGWSGDLSGSDDPAGLTMNGNKSVTANFKLVDYSVGAQVSPDAAGTAGCRVTGEGNQYHFSDPVSLQAVAATGWTFSGWSSNDITIIDTAANPLCFHMPTNCVGVKANFTRNVYNLNVKVTPDGSGTCTLNNNGPYYYGDSVTITTSPASGYSFSHWSGDSSDTTSQTTLIMNGNKSITANFTKVNYSLNINVVGNGSISGNNNSYCYHDPVNLQATADTGWTFSGWSSQEITINNPAESRLSFDMPNTTVTVTATFTRNEYTLTVNITGGGKVTQSPDQATYHYGDIVTLNPAASSGWTFSSFSSNVHNNQVTINDNTTVTATFISIHSSVTGGSILTSVAISGLGGSANLNLDPYGRALSNAELKTGDGKVTFDIAQNTRLSDANGAPLKGLSANLLTSPPSPPPQKAILSAYQFGPDGATFSPPITLTLSYDTSRLPEETIGSSVTLAYWDGKQWVTVPAKIDTTTGTVTAQISHFSQWALMASLKVTATTIPAVTSSPEAIAPVQTPVSTVTASGNIPALTSPPAVSPTPSPKAPTAKVTKPVMWIMLIGIMIVVAIVLGLFLVKRRRAQAK